MKFCAAVALTLSSVFGMAASLPQGYENRSAPEKLAYLLNRVNENHTSGPFRDTNNLAAVWKFTTKSYLMETQNSMSDELPPDHVKYIHAVGAVGGAHFEWNSSHNFTGLFQQADHCVLRFSSGYTPIPTPEHWLIPGLAVKCLRDGVASGNFVAMWQLDGYQVLPNNMKESCNFFGVPISNHVANRDDLPYSFKFLADISFARADPATGMVGLSNFANNAQDGKTVANPNFPFALVFNPSDEARNLACQHDVSLSQMSNIRPGMVLYDVYAVREPVKDDATPDIIPMGKLKADTAFTPSKYGDEELFFRHDYFTKDQQHRSDWKGLENDADFLSHEGVLKYMRHLPGYDAAFYAKTSMRGGMLASDTDLVV